MYVCMYIHMYVYMQVTVVGYKSEPEAFRAHFPYWLAWAPMVSLL